MRKKLSILGIFIMSFLCFHIPVAAAGSLYEEEYLNHVTDHAYILSDDELQKLEEEAARIEEYHDFGIYIITVDDYRDYSDGDVFDSAKAIYEYFSLGKGEGMDGVLLLLSMDDRDYSLMTYGDRGNYTFNTAGREKMVEYFLDDFADDYWYTGFQDYLTWCDNYLIQAEAGTPYGPDHVAMDSTEKAVDIGVNAAFILGVPLVVAGVVILILNSMMKSVAMATEASAYMSGGLDLIRSSDHYTHTTESRRKIETSSSSGGGSSSRSSGSASGTSGKF